MDDVERWRLLWGTLRATGKPDELLADLQRGYASPGRYYHTIEHIRACLEELDSARHLCKRPECVELALWFHDVVYDPRAKDNEEQSATMLLQAARRMGLAEELAGHAARIVRETAHADPAGRGAPDIDAALARDVDLAILGKPQPVFAAYERAIRKEYGFLPDSEFHAGRARVLEGFLARPTIYLVELFRGKYEEGARANLAQSLEALRKGTPRSAIRP